MWGDSLGGLITQTLAEKHPEWVSGAAPLCGVLAGSNLNLDLALDVAYAVKTLIYPDLKLTGFASHDEAVQNWQGAYEAITKAGGDTENGVPTILLTAALVDAPAKTKTYDGSTIESQVRARAESILTALGYGTYGRYEIEQRVGGNASGNDQADYSARRQRGGAVADRDRVEPARPTRCSTKLDAGERVTADETARAEFDRMGNPTGKLKDPTVTLHTTADPLVLVQNESVFRDRVYAAEGPHRRPGPALHVAAGDLLGRDRRALRRGPLQLHHRAAGRRHPAARQLGARRHGSGLGVDRDVLPGDDSVVSHYTPAVWPAAVATS